MIGLEVLGWWEGRYVEDEDLLGYRGVGGEWYVYGGKKKGIEDMGVSGELEGG